MPENNPLVSVIVLNWNGKRFLKNCIGSLLKQNYSRYEIMLIDNGSTDGSIEFVESIFDKTPKLKIVALNKNYGLNGINYLKQLYPNDYDAILWINKNIKGQPTMLEEQGDSYTDYERLSVNTGLPTVIGWTVHEWFWRNDYNIVALRIADVRTIYETSNLSLTKNLLKKYNVSYVFIGGLEKQKYINLNEDKFKKLGKVVFESGTSRLYKISP